MQVRYQAAPHTDKLQSIPCGLAFLELWPQQITYFTQFPAHRLQSLLGRHDCRRIRQTVFEVNRICKIVQNRITCLEEFHSLEHNFAAAPLVALALDEFLQFVSRTADGEALVVKQIPDSANHQHFVVLVITTVTAPFHWAQLRELLLPIPEHMRFHPAQFAHFTDGEVSFGRN